MSPTGNCTNDNTGKLIKDSKKNNAVALCLGNFAPPNNTSLLSDTFPTLLFENDINRDTYLVKHIPGDNVFSFDKEANYYAVIRPDVNSIVFNDALTHDNTEADKAVLYDKGKLIERSDELCDIGKSSGRYYSCYEGICYSTKKTSKVNESNGETRKV